MSGHVVELNIKPLIASVNHQWQHEKELLARLIFGLYRVGLALRFLFWVTAFATGIDRVIYNLKDYKFVSAWPHNNEFASQIVQISDAYQKYPYPSKARSKNLHIGNDW